MNSLEYLTVSDAQNRMLSSVEPVSYEQVNLSDASGRVLAQDILAETDLPPFSNASMDGYAVRAQDVREATQQTPIVLKVIGDIPAATQPDQVLSRGTALRIMTGAPLPRGCDAIVPVEYTSTPEAMADHALPEEVKVLQSVHKGAYIRHSGQDVPAGTMILRAGTRLRPQDIGMLAALGVARPRVFLRPKVGILSTGDELLEIDQQLGPGQIRDANGYALQAAVQAAGGQPLRQGIVGDQANAVANGLDRAVEAGADLILSSAGVSMGAFDFVRSVVEQRGDLSFWRVNIRPGKPLIFGHYRQVPLVGLPGNPVSALVTFEVFVRPLIAAMGGCNGIGRVRILAMMEHGIESDGRESYLRAILRWEDGSYKAKLTGTQDSGVLSSLVNANALVVVPAGIKTIGRGEWVEVWLLHDPCDEMVQ